MGLLAADIEQASLSVTIVVVPNQHGPTPCSLPDSIAVPNSPRQLHATAATTLSARKALCCVHTQAFHARSTEFTPVSAGGKPSRLFVSPSKQDPSDGPTVSALKNAGDGLVGFAPDTPTSRQIPTLLASDLSGVTSAPRLGRRALITCPRDALWRSQRPSCLSLPSTSCGALPLSHGSIALLRHGLARTAGLPEVLEINVDLASLGTALIFHAAALPPGVVVPGIWSLASGWAVASLARTALALGIWDTRRRASITRHAAVSWGRATRNTVGMHHLWTYWTWVIQRAMMHRITVQKGVDDAMLSPRSFRMLK